MLNDERLDSVIEGLHQISTLVDPIGKSLNFKERPSGIKIGKMMVPLGVIGMIYESRPNVTVDAAGLCIKSGNAIILRGGSEAIQLKHSLLFLHREEVSKRQDLIRTQFS